MHFPPTLQKVLLQQDTWLEVVRIPRDIFRACFDILQTFLLNRIIVFEKRRSPEVPVAASLW